MQPTTINITPPPNASQDILTLVVFVALAVSVLVHLMVAVAVMNDSTVLRRRGARLMFFGIPGWTCLALMTGLFGLLAYWFMHHSSFRPERNGVEEAERQTEHYV